MRLVAAGELVDEPVERSTRLLVFRQRRDVVVRQPQMKEWRTQHQDDRDHWEQHEERAAHDRRRDRVPPAGSRGIRLKERDPAAAEVAPNDREERRQEGEPVEDRARHHDRAGDAHRRQERALEEEHPREPDRHGQT